MTEQTANVETAHQVPMGSEIMTTQNDRNLDTALEGLDQNKRQTLRRLINGRLHRPVVASFAMQGMSNRPADANAGSSSDGEV